MLPFVVALGLALLLHLLVGWEWTLLAGVVYGFWVRRLAWLGAGVVGLLAWALLLLYSYVVAAESMGRMSDTIAALAGGSASWLVPLATLTVGFVLGALGGVLGAMLARFFPGLRKKSRPRGAS